MPLKTQHIWLNKANFKYWNECVHTYFTLNVCKSEL